MNRRIRKARSQALLHIRKPQDPWAWEKSRPARNSRHAKISFLQADHQARLHRRIRSRITFGTSRPQHGVYTTFHSIQLAS